MNTFRPTLIAAAVVATVAVGAMGLMTFRGETHEADSRSLCASAAWPMIPAECLEGAESRSVRVVGDVAEAAVDPTGQSLAMQDRFNTAFQ